MDGSPPTGAGQATLPWAPIDHHSPVAAEMVHDRPNPPHLDLDRATEPIAADNLSGELAEAAAKFGIRTLAEVPSDPPLPLKLGRLDPVGHTILFGPGGVGKGTLASDWIAKLAQAGETVLIIDYEDHPTEWARRIDGLGGTCPRILHVSPASASWRVVRGAIWDQADNLATIAELYGVSYIVIDSIVVACGGGEPKDSPSPSRYAAALARIGRPTLSLGHVTKSDDNRYPFGSAFWHNLARVTWSLTPAKDGAVLTNRKANNYADQGRFVVAATWVDGRLVEIRERAYLPKTADLIDEVLASQEPLAATAITEAINAARSPGQPLVKQATVRATLRRGSKAQPPVYLADGTGNHAPWRRSPR